MSTPLIDTHADVDKSTYFSLFLTTMNTNYTLTFFRFSFFLFVVVDANKMLHGVTTWSLHSTSHFCKIIQLLSDYSIEIESIIMFTDGQYVNELFKFSCTFRWKFSNFLFRLYNENVFKFGRICNLVEIRLSAISLRHNITTMTTIGILNNTKQNKKFPGRFGGRNTRFVFR